MRDLLDFSQRQEVQEYIERATDFKPVQGIAVRFDPFFAFLRLAKQSLAEVDWLELSESPYRRSRYTDWLDREENAGGRFIAWEPAWGGVTTEYGWGPPVWMEYLERLGGHVVQNEKDAPFIVVTVLTTRAMESELADLRGTADSYPFRTAFETRPAAVGLSRKGSHRPLEGGVSVGAPGGAPGTLGLVVEVGGIDVGVSCSHVFGGHTSAEQPSGADSGNPSNIGQVVASSNLTPESHCSPHATNTISVDAAIVEIDDAIKTLDRQVLGVGRLESVAGSRDVLANQRVQVSGRSGRRDLYTGGLAAVHSVTIAGTSYCYKQLIELKRTSPFRWAVTGTLRPPVRPGDSGSAIIQPGPVGHDWAGLVVAGDGPIGLACYAEETLNWMTSAGFAPSNLAVR